MSQWVPYADPKGVGRVTQGRPPPCPGSLFLLVGAQALLEEANSNE